MARTVRGIRRLPGLSWHPFCVNGLDIALGLAVLAAFIGGYRRGLLLRVSTWVFAVLGLLLVASNLDWVLQRLGSPKAGQRVGALLQLSWQVRL